jgi:DNA replication protein DnaC
MAQPDCTVCGGTGWRLVERVDANEPAERVVERKNAGSGGSVTPPRFTWAVPCDCTGGDRSTRALARARIPKRYEHCDFENFDTGLWEGSPQTTAWNRSLAQARVVVEAFARDYPAGGETGLLLMGPCGVGKTHLAVAALRQLMLRGHGARFYDYRELLKDIQASYDPEHPTSEMSVLEPVLHTEVLLLDDIGASKPSMWALETVGHILNKRYNEKRVTLLTTNYLDGAETPAAAPRLPSGQAIVAGREETLTERLGQRVRSRLYEMCRTVEIVSPDYRREIRQAGRVRS